MLHLFGAALHLSHRAGSRHAAGQIVSVLGGNPVARTWELLRDARTAGLVKLRRGVGVAGECLLWAGNYQKRHGNGMVATLRHSFED